MHRTIRRASLLALIGLTAASAPAIAGHGGHKRDHRHKANHGGQQRDSAHARRDARWQAKGMSRIKRFVVIYQENHSFDNLYGGWEKVDGLNDADAAHSTQVAQDGHAYQCLLQNDVNLAALPATCDNAAPAFSSHFENKPFRIDDFIKPEDTTCPPPGDFSMPNGFLNGTGRPGGCTRDLVHRFYQEQYQLNDGAQNRYTTGSDAAGLTQGTYDTRALPIYRYLHRGRHPKYVISDRFFQAAFGGSFLNHQWLVAAATPTYPNAPANLFSKVDANGMPKAYPPLYNTTDVLDNQLTVPCPHPGLACGNFAVNTIQPTYEPHGGGAQLPPQAGDTIGDRLSDKGIDWAWYSGGWSNANGDVDAPGWTNGSGPTCSDPNALTPTAYPHCADKLFQFHHQPLNYYASFAPGTPARAQHLRDETEFEGQLADSKTKSCKLKPVSFVKPIGAENEHPGYASEHSGSDHLVDLLKGIHQSRCAKGTMVIVTYDEFGGQWDHVPPPGQGSTTPGPADEMGPGTRIPALTIAPRLKHRFGVDDASHDTTSIMATIEHRFGLDPISSRDASVQDMSTVFSARH